MNRVKQIILNWSGITALNESMKALQWKVGIHREKIETINNEVLYPSKAMKSDIKALQKRIELLESLAFTGDDNHANLTN